MLAKLSVNATLQDIFNTKLTPPPRAKATWKGVPHGELIGEMLKAAEERHLRPQSDARFNLSRGGADLAAAVPLWVKPTMRPFNLMPYIGVVSSNAQKHTLQFYCGAIVLKEDLPFVVARLSGVGRRHWYFTQAFDLKKVMGEALDWWVTQLPFIEGERHHFEKQRLSDDAADIVLMEAARQDFIQWSLVGKADAWFRQSHHAKSAWDLVMACGTTMYQSPPMFQMGRAFGVYEVISQKLFAKGAA